MDRNTILVVMPVYNSQKTLSNAIESILNQTYKNFVLQIVDDNSEDDSYKIALSYAYDKRVTVHKNNKNYGAYYCRNMGLFLNKDKSWGYFTTHDSDDISYSNRFFTIMKAMKKQNAMAIQDTFERKRLADGSSLGESLTMAHALFKRKVFNDIGYFETVRFGADWEHWRRLVLLNKISENINLSIRQVMGESFVHKNNLTVQIPVNSLPRRKYIASSRKEHMRMIRKKSFYRDFDPKDYR